MPSPAVVLLSLWALGALLMLIRLMQSARQGQIWRRLAARVPFTHSSPLSKPVHIYRSSHIHSPMVLGLLRPSILVPQDFKLDFNTPATRAVLEHEIAHIVRKDLWVNLAQRLVLAMLWWCAPLYWVNTQINVEREKICDDIAAHKFGKCTEKNSKALAQALLDLAEKHTRVPTPALAIGIHPRARHLTARIHRLYIGNPMTKISKKLLLTTTLALPMTLACLTIITPRAYAHNPFADHIDTRALSQNLTPEQFTLYASAEHGNRTSVQALLANGVNPNFVLHGDGSPLLVAVRRNDSKMVDMFLAAKADTNITVPGDGTPLIAAAIQGNLQIMQKLIDHGAQVNYFSSGDGNPLIAAASTNHIDAAKLLLSQGADINGVVPGDETALINASQQGYLDMVKFLLTQGADINLGAWAKTRKGMEWRTPLGEAKLHRHKDIEKFLIANNARYETRTYDPDTDDMHTDITTYNTSKHTASHISIVEGDVSSRYGHIRKGKIFAGKKHNGMDIANAQGTPIYAPADGQVQVFNEFSFRENYGPVEKYGKTLELKTAGGVTTLFAHLQSFAVRQGDTVKAGDIIAYMGNTGVSSGPHVHIETHVNGKRTNPQTVWPKLK